MRHLWVRSSLWRRDVLTYFAVQHISWGMAAEHCNCMKACLVSSGVVLNFLIKKTHNLHFKPGSKLHSTKHCNWLFSSGPSCTYLQIKKFEQKMMKSLNMSCCWFFPLKMKFRLILVHPYVKCSVLSGVYFQEEHFYGIRKYHIVSNPIFFDSQPACYTPVNWAW